jgi:signal transduction histidine kinase/DNA-binding response OmpR family regulator
VLADVMMPNLDGFGLMSALRADERTRSIPIVMLSARAGEEARVEGLQAGADDYLVKPFSARELIARVRTHLEIARLRRVAELQVRKLSELFEQAPAVISIFSGRDHVYRFANAPYLRSVGDRDIIGKPIREALPELDGHGVYDLLDEAFASGRRVIRSEWFTKLERDGQLEDTYWNLVYQPYRDSEGHVEGVMAFGYEVTAEVRARQQAEALTRELQESKADAEGASRAKDEFLAVLGHELRNPLAPILTALHIMRLRDGDRSANERAIIERQAQHLVGLVDDLLDVSRITRGKVELKKRRTEVSEVVAHAIEMASPLLEQRQHNLAVDVPPRGLVIDCDPARLGQVLSNLLTNAAKYTEHGGQISVMAREARGQVTISVRDTGIGIAPEMLPRVFDMFVQERQALDRAQGGLGLGLTIVRSLVALHGGTIDVRSEGRGRGAEFVVTLPAAAAGEAETVDATQEHAEAMSMTGRRILIVDDNEDAAELLAASLELMGHRTAVAHDGPQALKLVAGFVPEIAMLDIGLPVMDGYELARRLRDADLPAVRLVAVTGYGQDADRQRSQAAGFDAHLVKPIDVARLPSLIDELTNHQDESAHRNPVGS